MTRARVTPPQPGSRSHPRSASKGTNRPIQALRTHGLTVEKGGTAHWKVFDATGIYLLTFSATSGDTNHIKAIKRDLRRYHGIVLP